MLLFCTVQQTRGAFQEGVRIHFAALTGVRFPLAVWVVAHHMTGPKDMLGGWVRSLPDPGQAFFEMAYVALGTFFLLSGFVLARSYAATEWRGGSLARYWVARVARIYPLYLLSLLVVAPIMYRELVYGPGLGSAFDRAGLALNYGFLLQAWAPLPVNWNTPAWSLSCELFFYLLFPAALVLLRRRPWFAMALAFALPVGVRFLGAPAAWKPVLFLGDFVAGVALAGCPECLTRRWPRLAGRGYLFYLPATALFLGLIAGKNAIPSWGLLDGGLRLANVALILGLALGGGLAARALSARAAVELGKATYAMYILHIPLLWWYKRSPACFLLPQEAAAVLFVVTLAVLSVAVCRRFEEPANRWIRQAYERVPAYRAERPRRKAAIVDRASRPFARYMS